MKKTTLLLFPLIASFAHAEWWWHTSYTEGSDPVKYCVRDGIFSGTTRCMDHEKAKALDFDDRKVFGAANNPTMTTQLAAAQKEIDRATKDYEQKQREYEGHKDALARLKAKSETGTMTRTEFAALDGKMKALEATVSEAGQKAGQAKMALMKAQTAGAPSAGQAEMQSEVARRGLLIKVTDLESKLSTFEDNIRATETELNNSVLEAYLAAKFSKLADSFCELKAMCDSNPKGVKTKLMESLVSGELRSQFVKPAQSPSGSK